MRVSWVIYSLASDRGHLTIRNFSRELTDPYCCHGKLSCEQVISMKTVDVAVAVSFLLTACTVRMPIVMRWHFSICIDLASK